MRVEVKFTDTQLKKLLKENFIILADTREQKNQHILNIFDEKKIKYEETKLDAGDYGVKLSKNEELGLLNEIILPVAIEKKNSVDELANSIKERQRFENEFLRAKDKNIRIHLLIEEEQGYRNIVQGKYRSEYQAKAFKASLKAFESRYNFTTVFISKEQSADWIFNTLYYATREFLKE